MTIKKRRLPTRAAMAALLIARQDQRPFKPFAVRITDGTVLKVARSDLMVVMKSQLFVVNPNSDRGRMVPFVEIAAVGKTSKGDPLYPTHPAARTPPRRRP